MDNNDYDDYEICDDFYDDQPECDHEDYEADILTGRASCNRCDHTWWQTSEEIQREIRHQHEYDQWCAEQYRREDLERHWWGRIWLAIKALASHDRAFTGGRDE